MKPVTTDNPLDVFSQTPFMRLLDMKRAFSQDGHARITLDPSADVGNVIGAVHGGVVSTMLDVAMASAAVSCVNFTRTVVTLNLTTNFLAPGRGLLTADGEVLHHDNAVVWCSAKVTDADGKTIAQAHGSFRFLEHPKPVIPTNP